MPKVLCARPAGDTAEEKKIRKLSGARHAPGDWIQRARVITLSWDGWGVPAIATAIGCHEKTVRRWLHRFNDQGLDGLADRPGCGRKRRITESERSHLIALVKTDPPGRPMRQSWGDLYAADEAGPPVWTLDTLTAAARSDGIDIHRSQVRTILLAEGVRWRRTRSWITSKDSDFAPKERGSSASTPTRPKTPR
ncbi:Transposase [Streptosporangium subroseum]|uniref:Transposase n=1 Tax=Streptosporangium subroseum TaxID=106412 RepID=A0A239LZX7_9ACTN|nr:helix-turn-helix domain-containing protein [Streptosporangium subroseum]SNT35830.1 Transposase [Streptosporangium subroseum]